MKATVSLVAGVIASVVAALALAALAGGLGMASAWIALSLGMLLAVAAWRGVEARSGGPLRIADAVMCGIFALASLRAFLWLVGQHDDEVFVLSPNNLGDMSLHLNFIRNFASGVPFWPESPILSGTPLTYPLGSDLFNALLECIGVNTYRGLVWTGLGGAALIGWSLWRWGGAFALASLLFNGGLAGFEILGSWSLQDFQSDLVWKNLFLSMIVTQRGLLVALPAGFMLLDAWRDEWFRQRHPGLPRWLQVLFYAAMPLFSLHSFLFLSVVLAGLFVYRPIARRALAVLVGAAFVPATAGVLCVTGMLSASGGVHLAWGWMAGAGGLWQLPRDFGLVIPLGLATLVVALRQGRAEERFFVMVAAALFGLCSVVAFASWPWDNMKILLWCWLACSPYLWSLVIAPLPAVARAGVCTVLFFSLSVSLAGGLDARHGYCLARRSELDAWRSAMRDIPATDRFAVVPVYNHPVILLGRQVACGYEGHLWSHGLDYRMKHDVLTEAMAGRVPWVAAAPVLDVQWVAVRALDRTDTMTARFGMLYDVRETFMTGATAPAHPPSPPRPVN